MNNSVDDKKLRNRLAAKRCRDRKKAISLGLSVSMASRKQKVGRKVSKDPTIEGDERRMYHRLRYSERKKKIESKKRAIVRLPERVTRNSLSIEKDYITEVVAGKLQSLSKKIDSDFSNVQQAKATMECVIQGIKNCFSWVKTSNGTYKMFFVETVRDEDVYHPWVEAKKSELANEEDGGFPYGMFACRTFKMNDCIGIYVGRVFLGTDEEKNESIYKISVGDGMFHVDIDDIGEGRLTYGMGMHLINDCHFGEVSKIRHDRNNTHISWDLSVSAKKDIERGEELSLSYNYNS